MGSGFANESSWLLIPWVGPWLTLGFRDYKDCANQGTTTTAMDASADGSDVRDGCAADALAMSGLIIDGIVQTAGGVLMLLGYTLKKQQLERNAYGLHLTPVPIARGYGLGVNGWF
jgi:hypothetical protein